MAEVRSMTDNLVERLRDPNYAGPFQHLRPYDEIDALFVEAATEIERLEANITRLSGNPADHRYWEGRWRDADAEITRLQEALAAAETEREWLAKLQSALAFWMPSVTEAIEIELNGRAGDDAYLLAGFDGEVPVPSWGDKAISRAEAAEAKLASLPALLAETRKKALEEAAQVAENTVDFNDDGLSTFDASQITAAAIRALAEEVRK